MASLRDKMKMAKAAAKDGEIKSAWTTMKVSRGGNTCKGCGERWDKMSKGRIIAHAECEDSDGCPDTKD